ncbi:MAG: hypothetical protein J6R85_00290 [Lentisphaeria bacterium]|nr:hypothetical protein [Lentisphaeria bacterium]
MMNYSAVTAKRPDPERIREIAHTPFPGGVGMVLSKEARNGVGEADLIFEVDLPEAGRYQISTTGAATFGSIREKMRVSHSKYDSIRLWIAINDGFPRDPVVVCPWQNQDFAVQSILRKDDFHAGKNIIRIWLPEEVIFHGIALEPYTPPAVPPEADRYEPSITPPAAHPRIWVTPERLPEVRANLNHPENLPVWQELQAEAQRTVLFDPPANSVVGHMPEVLQNIAAKAFVYLMTEDAATGRAAVDLLNRYLQKVEFDNLLDITRELGEVIYTGARVYDWCYPLLTPEMRSNCRRHLLRLADDMEIGWPPFLQPVTNGHGNEAQVNRDLLAMSIAFYGDDDRPYQLCSWLILDQLKSLREVEYGCGRHNQGTCYGAYRFANEMHAAWLLRIIAGYEVFHPNIKTVYNLFFHYRMPDGSVIVDGDGSTPRNPLQWGATLLTFLCATYTKNPFIKGDFLREGGRIPDPALYLALNDPELKAELSLESLPLTCYFKGFVPGMSMRTGWNIGKDSDDAVILLRGAGWHSGNHQHSEAGSFQIFYRGGLAVDLGLYGFYGVPYDMGYYKRSISHNVMLAYQPDEVFPARGTTFANDGGQRLNQELAITPEMLTRDSVFFLGDTLGADHRDRDYLWLSSELAPAYNGKIRQYQRHVCVWDLQSAEHPAAVIVADAVETAQADYRKYFVLNTMNEPEFHPEGLRCASSQTERPGYLDVTILAPEARNVEKTGGECGKASSFFGVELQPPYPEHPNAKGWRTMITPEKEAPKDFFLTVMVLSADGASPLPVVKQQCSEEAVAVLLPGRIAVLPASDHAISEAFELDVPETAEVLLCGMAPKVWNAGGNLQPVYREQGTLRCRLEAGHYTIFPTEI